MRAGAVRWLGRLRFRRLVVVVGLSQRLVQLVGVEPWIVEWIAAAAVRQPASAEVAAEVAGLPMGVEGAPSAARMTSLAETSNCVWPSRFSSNCASGTGALRSSERSRRRRLAPMTCEASSSEGSIDFITAAIMTKATEPSNSAITQAMPYDVLMSMTCPLAPRARHT